MSVFRGKGKGESRVEAETMALLPWPCYYCQRHSPQASESVAWGRSALRGSWWWRGWRGWWSFLTHGFPHSASSLHSSASATFTFLFLSFNNCFFTMIITLIHCSAWCFLWIPTLQEGIHIYTYCAFIYIIIVQFVCFFRVLRNTNIDNIKQTLWSFPFTNWFSVSDDVSGLLVSFVFWNEVITAEKNKIHYLVKWTK